MISLVAEKLDELKALCIKHRVRKLALFGSAANSDFNPKTSDLDFLASFEELPPIEYKDHFFGLLYDLEDLFHRRIDLVTEDAIRNPYRRQSILSTNELIYEEAA
jgi:predicted nucleotidyltransferase